MQQEVFKIISDEFTKSKAKNPSYSLRAYSRRLGIQVSALSEIINGKREITKKMATKILTGLALSPEEIELIVNKVDSHEDHNLSLDHFRVISDWYYFAILSLSETENFVAQPDDIATRLNITRREASHAMDRLTNLNMLEKDKNGKYRSTGIQYKTPTDILNASLKNHTVQTLELAKESLFKDPIEKRDFSTVTMSIDPSDLAEAKKMIKAFRKKITKKLESGKKKEVYKLSIALFPLSR